MSDNVIASSSGYTLKDFQSFSSCLAQRYDSLLDELPSAEGVSSVEEAFEARNAKVREISLDLANDFTTLQRFRLANAGDYFAKQVDPLLSYLRDVRQSVNLYLSAVRAPVA